MHFPKVIFTQDFAQCGVRNGRSRNGEVSFFVKVGYYGSKEKQVTIN